jgi:hypothetical protein
MKCRLVPVSEPHYTGRQLYRCSRYWCKGKGLMPKSGRLDRLQTKCKGWPFWNEWREWLELILIAAFIYRDLQRFAWKHLRLTFGPLLPLEIDGGGPGNELAIIIHSLRVGKMAAVCNARRKQMNLWGAECREHREEILGWLRDAYRQSDPLTKVRAGILAVAYSHPLTLAGLLQLAIERAEGRA